MQSWIAQLTNEGDGSNWVSYGVPDLKREVHVYPQEDIVIHTLHMDCPCSPILHDEGIVTHNAWDCRELFEDLKEV